MIEVKSYLECKRCGKIWDTKEFIDEEALIVWLKDGGFDFQSLGGVVICRSCWHGWKKWRDERFEGLVQEYVSGGDIMRRERRKRLKYEEEGTKDISNFRKKYLPWVMLFIGYCGGFIGALIFTGKIF